MEALDRHRDRAGNPPGGKRHPARRQRLVRMPRARDRHGVRGPRRQEPRLPALHADLVRREICHGRDGPAPGRQVPAGRPPRRRRVACEPAEVLREGRAGPGQRGVRGLEGALPVHRAEDVRLLVPAVGHGARRDERPLDDVPVLVGRIGAGAGDRGRDIPRSVQRLFSARDARHGDHGAAHLHRRVHLR